MPSFIPYSLIYLDDQNCNFVFAVLFEGESYKGTFHPLTDRSNISFLSTSRFTRMVAAILKLEDLNKIVSQQEF
jgi:hypothetical protein